MDCKKIAIYGGAFDPPHVGHVLTPLWLLSVGIVDRVWIFPSHNHPFAKQMSSFEDRVNMCELAFGVFEDVNVKQDEKLVGGGGSTVELVTFLREKYPSEYKFVLIVGADNWAIRDKWEDWGNLMKLVEDVVVLGREGYETHGAFKVADVSSTDIRACIRAGQMTVGDNEIPLNHMVPYPVLEYIKDRGLYV